MSAKVKGRTLLDTLASIRERVGEAAFQSLVGSLEPAVREPLREVLASQWYPLDVMTGLLNAEIRAFDGGDAGVLVGRAEAVVEKQLRGIYRIFIRLGSPEWIVKRIAAIHQAYFQGIDVGHEILEANRARVTYTGFESQHAILANVIVGFYRKALQLSGAADVRVHFQKPIGASDGKAVLLVSWVMDRRP
ncbi:MAG TPA: hypothetical protein VFG53_09955 [Anaeromyxobacter sp.]|nr:hypothetical protein [Anaeromyxobacter sp.]